MSMFEDSRYRWRETYFVLFDAKRRPTAEKRDQDARRAEQAVRAHAISAPTATGGSTR